MNMPIMAKVSELSVIIFTYRMLWFFTLSKDGHVSWLFTEQESLKWTVSHRGQLQDKYLYVTSLKAAGKPRDIDQEQPIPQDCRAREHVWLPAALCTTTLFPLCLQGTVMKRRAGLAQRKAGGPRLTGVMRMAACAPQPCMARCRVSLNMLRSSTAWQYTASMRGHQSRADCKARAA